MDMEILQIIAKAQSKTVEQIKKEITDSNNEAIETSLPAKTKSKKQPSPPQILQLTLWSDSVRGVPNSALRSALFSVIRQGKRKSMFKEKLSSNNGITVIFTGFKLDQADLDVWQRVLHISKETLGQQVNFTANSFLKGIGRTASGASYKWLKDSLTRLQSAVVEIKDGSKTYSGQLIHNYYIDEQTRECVVELNPKLSSLLGDEQWTGLEWEQRKKLLGKPLALWLHGFYSTHSEPFEYKIETIHKLCGSETIELFKFKQNLSDTLKDLSAATNWLCKIENDKLKVIKPALISKKTSKYGR
jgi:hypothetical protein